MKPFSITSFKYKLQAVGKRFPIAILLLTVLSGFLWSVIWESTAGWDGHILKLFSIFLPIGVIVSVVVTLGLENVVKRLWQYILNIVALLLWGSYCDFLTAVDTMYFDVGMQIFIICAVFVASIFYISFLKKGQDAEFWIFSKKLVVQIAWSGLILAILYAGLCVALFSVESLFYIGIGERVYASFAIICCWLTAIYLLANIPDKVEKHNTQLPSYWALKILGMYVLLPILGIYLLISYTYILQIIITWQLPNGYVSTLVSILCIVGLLTIALLYPNCLKKENKVVMFVSRYFGLLVLPLLVLMSVGIFRRIGDYGITINRCYMLVLNLWFYGIFIYLFIAKSRSIRWILISPTLIFLLVSIGPWRISNVTKHVISNKLEKTLHQLNFPKDENMSLTDYTQFFEQVDKQQITDIRTSIDYLIKTYGRDRIPPYLLTCRNVMTDLRLNNDETTVTEPSTVTVKWFDYTVKDIKLSNIQKYNNFIDLEYDRYDVEGQIFIDSDDKNLSIEIYQDNRNFHIPAYRHIVSMLEAMEQTTGNIYFSDTNETIVIKGINYVLYIKEVSGRYDVTEDKLEIHTLKGFLFYN